MVFASLAFTACGDVDNPLEEIVAPNSDNPITPTTTTITLNLDGNIVSNDKFYFLPGDAAISIATITEGAPVTITSSDENVITIDADGNVVPVGPGTATITITVTENEEYTGASETVTIVVGRKVSLADETGSEFVAQNGDQITGIAPNNMHLSIPDGALVRLKDATIKPTSGPNTAAIICEGDATLFIEGVNDVRGKGDSEAGIQAGPDASTLTIDGTGKLTSVSDTGAGLGGTYNGTCGNIVIKDGDLTVSSVHGAAIGGGAAGGDNNISKCGNITISGGKVAANSAVGAAIGSGATTDNYNTAKSSCGDILITGGEIEATTASGDARLGAAIGTGRPYNGHGIISCGEIRITDGKVTATAGSDGVGSCSAAIGTAFAENGSTTCGNIIIEGGIIVATCIAYPSWGAAGIGTGCIYGEGSGTNTCGNIELSGGTITTNGGKNGAGIGMGSITSGSSTGTINCGDITISGGTVTARTTNGGGAADIGKGGSASGTMNIGTVSIDDTNLANYTAVAGGYKHN